MANTLNGLIPDFQEGMDIVSRELVGMIPAVTTDARLDRVMQNQNVTIPITRDAGANADNTPGVTAPDTGDTTVDNIQVTISKSKHQPIRFNGEETLGLSSAGTFSSIMAQRTYQAMRKLVNEIEADLWLAAKVGAGTAFGTAATTPFGTANDLSDFAGALGLMERVGAPTNDLQNVLGSAAMGNLRGKQAVLFKVNESGSSDMLRNGMTDRVMNQALRQSSAVATHTKGTGASYLTNSASLTAGTTVIAADTGTGTILVGDVVTFAGDTTKYVVTSALSAGLFSIGCGLINAVADNVAITVGNNYTGNLIFDRSAIVLAARMPAMPMGGDQAVDVTSLTDAFSGLTFEFALYKQFLQNVVHVRLAWGVKSIKTRHVGLLLG